MRIEKANMRIELRIPGETVMQSMRIEKICMRIEKICMRIEKTFMRIEKTFMIENPT